MESKEQDRTHQIIHSGLTGFPTLRHVMTLAILVILEIDGIYLSIPLTKNSSISFLIAQIILLTIIIYSWVQILEIVPGPMSQLFNQQIQGISNIQQGICDIQSKSKTAICSECQIKKVNQIYHCETCNRCVYKYFFHSKWLNTCIAKENFPSFIAFLIFLDIYLILLQIDHLLKQPEHWTQFINIFRNNSIQSLESFLNIFSILSFFIISFLIIAVTLIIISSCYFAFKISMSIVPSYCNKECKKKQNANLNDKILRRVRQSVRQTNFIYQNNPVNQSLGGQFSKQAENFSAFQFFLKVLKQRNIIHLKKQRKKNQMQKNEQNKDSFLEYNFSASNFFSKKIQNSLFKNKNKIQDKFLFKQEQKKENNLEKLEIMQQEKI